MKHSRILLFLSFFILSLTTSHAQQYDSYESLWEKVKQLENDALAQSALKAVEAISAKAKKEGDSAQTLKALLYISKYALTLKENAQLKIVSDFRSEITTAEFPVKNVLESYLANLYWQYFQQNRYQFYDRTLMSKKVDSTDFRTWDLITLFQEINSHFEASLENKDSLQKTNLDDFKAIVEKEPGSETYRPTLFDLLAHTALQFYKTDETSITRPADLFEIDRPEILCEAQQFIRTNLNTDDETSLQAKALRTYQQLIAFHFSDADKKALVDVDIERLNFTFQNAIFQNKDARYLEVLQNSAEILTENPLSGLYIYEIARSKHQLGNNFQPKAGEENRWKQKDALALCDSIIARFPKSRGAEKCKALKSRILAPSLQLTTENFLPVDTDTRLLVDYKNVKQLQLSALKISRKELDELDKLYSQNKQLDFLKKLSVAKKWEAILKDEQDYQRHSIEISVPSFDNGQYVILASPTPNIDVKQGTVEKNETFAFSPVQVTDMALIATRTPESYDFQVIDRNDGHPISGAKVQLSYLKNYNAPRSNTTLETDKQGSIGIPLSEENWTDVNVTITNGGEQAIFGPYYVSRKYDSNDEPRNVTTAFLFTDRSIYRPGQPLYFKGIVLKKQDGKSVVAPDENVILTLKDVNAQKVSEQDFATNEFGSISGEFILPNNGLTGQYSIEIRGSGGLFRESQYFSVEEYKRPKFETFFTPITETYRVNDSIKVHGTAAAFAGSVISEAKVGYRVKRVVEFPEWYYWHYPYFNSTPQEIAHGETFTDASGRYKIDFKALPDNTTSEEDLPIFRYEITADVTDINGETQSATTIVSVGYHLLTATIGIPDLLNKDNPSDTLTIITKNLNGQPIAAQGTLRMYKLQSPEQVVRPRPWEAPDYKNWDKESFKEEFPYDAYDGEDDPKTWEKGKLVWETDFDTDGANRKSNTQKVKAVKTPDTASKTHIKLPDLKKWTSGRYVIELETQDKFGQVVKEAAQTVLYSDKDKRPADHQLFRIKLDKDTYEVGDNAEVTLSSAAKNLTVSVFVEKDKKIIDTRIIKLGNNSKTFSVPVTADDLGGFAIDYSFSAFNSFHSGSLPVSVPYPKTDLQIEALTFRDKLQPGTDETWSFKVKGAKGEKVGAELLAGMYDASLDAFLEHSWNFNALVQPTYYSSIYTDAGQSFGVSPFRSYLDFRTYPYLMQTYDKFKWFGLSFDNSGYNFKRMKNGLPAPLAAANMSMEAEVISSEMTLNDTGKIENPVPMIGQALGLPSEQNSDKEANDVKNDQDSNFEGVQIRKNLQETAFFFPQLRTDEEGNVSFHFTTPEALTRWKLQLLAHTKNLESSIKTLETVTQKELMVIPNFPRFLREGDEITISTKIVNLTAKPLSGQVKLELMDAVSGKGITGQLLASSFLEETSQKGNGNGKIIQKFEVDSLNNTQVSWHLKIPKGLQAVQYKIIAKAGDFSDGEQNLLPVLTNRELVTETLPMWVRSGQSKTFVLDNLKNSSSFGANTKNTLRNHKLTLEITSNPAWYAVLALPYLMEYPYECNEQTFARYYANSLASHIANVNPCIREVFDQWANSDALISNLEKNEELKSILIQETPWLRDAQSETEQKKRIALLFNLDKMKNEQANALNKLRNGQKPSGAWAWFNGGPDNRLITQHIISGMGHLKHLDIIPDRVGSEKSSSSALSPDRTQDSDPTQDQYGPIETIIQNAITYLDTEFVKEYEEMKKYASDLDDDHLSPTQIHYLYMRSFFPDIKTSKEVDKIISYYKVQAQKYWTKTGLYSKGMLALVLHRSDDKVTAKKILRSLKENSIMSEEMGMYWKGNVASWHWNQATIETQALMIEAFGEINLDSKSMGNIEIIDNLKIWLLKNKQTNQWETTKATTEAVYALLLQGSDWLSVTDAVEVSVGGEKITPSNSDGLPKEDSEVDRSTKERIKLEAGTGYYKTSWNGNEIRPEMAEVKLIKKGDGIAWGALYWQYFEDLDKITSAETPLEPRKKLFLKKNTDTGEEISEITSKTNLKIGDLVRVRIELRSGRDMEFLHMKDMRAAGFEPINVLSSYKWQDGLGYYESTKDASTNFFFDYLPKGVYVFEYDLRVNNAGQFSNGITTIQSMYAPEFSSHSAGVRVKVDSP